MLPKFHEYDIILIASKTRVSKAAVFSSKVRSSTLVLILVVRLVHKKIILWAVCKSTNQEASTRKLVSAKKEVIQRRHVN